MLNKCYVNFAIFAVFLFLVGICTAEGRSSEGAWGSGPLVKREERKSIVSTEYGEISAVRVTDNNGSYLLHFFTLEPNALFLPVILHADMVFYVHTGSGRLSWTDEDGTKQAELRRGDIYRLQQGSVFYIQSNLETQTERQKLRIHAIFVNSDDLHEPVTGPYSDIREMVTGFDRNVLQAAFKVPGEVIDELLSGTKQMAFIHGISTTKKREQDVDMEAQFISSVLDSRSYNIFESNKKKKKSKTENAKLFNIFKEDKDVENCNGWSTAVTRKKLHALQGTNIGAFMVNLAAGSMMGPHWNPMATEIAIALHGRGMVRVVCSDASQDTSCRNTRLLVEEGDVFVVPRFHPMAQMGFNNDTFVFIGFSTSTKKNHPQFLAGQASVLRTLDRDVLAMSFNVTNTTLDQFLTPQRDSVILGCISCAEEELRVMQEDVERKREEARKREEEAAKKREQEKRREEEEAREREEAEARKQEEERRKREEEEEEAAKRKEVEEAEARRKQEEAARRKEEQEAEARRKEEEAEARRKEEEAEARRKEEEEAEARRKEEEAEARRKEEEEAEARRKEEEAEARRKEEEAEARRKEEEEAEARRKEEEEAEARRKEEEAEARRQEEEAEAARQEEERRRQEEEAARQEEERRRQEEEAARQEEERRRQEEEAASRREEEERQKSEEEEASARKQEEERRKQEEQQGGKGHEEEQQGGGQSEEEQAAEQERRREEEERKEAEEEAAKQRGGGEAGGTPQLLKLTTWT